MAYLLILGPEAAAARLGGWLTIQLEARPELRLEHLDPEALLVHDGSTPVLRSAQATVIGRLHARGSEDGAFDQAQFEALARGPLDETVLRDRFWGGYLAIFSKGPGRHDIFRDPSGDVLARWRAASPFTHFFSEIDLPASLGLAELELDQLSIARQLRWPHLRTATSGIAGVRELLPGCLWRSDCDQAGATRLVWNPADHCEPAPPSWDRTMLPDAVRATARTLARPHESVLLELSGGLDSSILAAALRHQPRLTALNLATQSEEGDERRYAGAVAGRFGIPLRTHCLEPALCLDTPPLRLFPGIDPVLRAIDRVVGAEAESAGADALMSGIGGDNVFCSLSTAAPVVDALLALGSRRAWSTLHDVARRTQCSLWTALRFAAVKWRRRNMAPPWVEDRRLLGDVADALVPEPHPWLEAASGLPPGKVEHVRLLLAIHGALDAHPRGRNRPILRPYCAQPVMEACLPIPSWRWIAGGRDRAAARAAFATDLPTAVANRRTKGRLEGHYRATFELARGALEQLLLDGWLARNQILDSSKLAAALRADMPALDNRFYLLLLFASVELWVQSVLAARSRSARHLPNCAALCGAGSSTPSSQKRNQSTLRS